VSHGASFTLGRLADALGASLRGDAARVVTGVAPLETAGPEHVSFVTDRKYLEQAEGSRAGAFVVARDVVGLPGALLQVDQPQQALIALLELFHPEAPAPSGAHPAACVAEGARIDRTASVGPLAVVEAGDQGVHERDGHLRVFLEEGRELPGHEQDAIGIGVGHHGGAPRVLLDKRQLPEEVARAEVGHRRTLALPALHVHLPGQDDVQGRSRGALADDRFARGVGAVLALLGQALDRLAIEARQERRGGEGGFDVHGRMVAPGWGRGKGPPR